MDRLKGRYREDVSSWVEEQIGFHIADNNLELQEEDTPSLAHSTLDKVVRGVMLEKEEAKWLENLLSETLEKEIENRSSKSNRPLNLMEVDAWSIHADAWGIYCRPGTYRVF